MHTITNVCNVQETLCMCVFVHLLHSHLHSFKEVWQADVSWQDQDLLVSFQYFLKPFQQYFLRPLKHILSQDLLLLAQYAIHLLLSFKEIESTVEHSL